MDIATNDVIKFDKIIKLPIKEQKQEINDRIKSVSNRWLAIDFEKKEFPLEKINSLFSYIISESYDKSIILRNITDLNYQFIKILEPLYKTEKKDNNTSDKIIKKEEDCLKN